MRERPILFSGPMVRAILEGRKTQTRRVIKPQPDAGIKLADPLKTFDEHAYTWPVNDVCAQTKCPYGKPGDRLWVRETHTFGDSSCGYYDGTDFTEIIYKADDSKNICSCTGEQAEKVTAWIEEKEATGNGENWRPSIHMPRWWASRISLEITNIRVERVQDIGHGDALAEGVDSGRWLKAEGERINPHNSCAWNRFAVLWDSINAKRGHGWAENPWVWAVEFKVLNAAT